MPSPQSTQTVTILLSFISALTVAVFSKIWDSYFATVNYKRDYYKKLIEKRLEALNLVHDVVAENYLSEEKLSDQKYLSFFSTNEIYNQRIAQLITIASKNFYYSNNLDEKLKSYVTFVTWEVSEKKAIDPANFNIRTFGVENFNTISTLHRALGEALNEELKTLYDIKVFLKNNK